MHIWCRTIEIFKGMTAAKWDVDNCKNLNYPVFYSLKCEVYHIFQYLFHKYKKKKNAEDLDETKEYNSSRKNIFYVEGLSLIASV